MALRYYRNGPARALSFPIALSSDTTMTVDSASGFPTQFPYTLIIEPDTALEEVVDVTAAVGNVLTITRGVDSTTASAHAAGSTVYHGVSARDMREANAHVNATTNVHGRTGELVDTDSAQTIVGAKNFTGGLTTTAGAVVTVGGTQTITGAKTFDSLSTTAGGAVVAVAGPQTVTGAKTFSGAVTFSNSEAHGGGETHNGTETHNGLATFTNDVSVDGANITGAWSTYTTARHNGAGGATLGVGNGTQDALFKRVGKTVHFRISLLFGSTTAIGTDDYAFTLPLAPAVSVGICGAAVLSDATSGKFFAKNWHGIGGLEVVIVAENGDRVSGAGGGSPILWATGDRIILSGSYEAA